MNPWSYKPWWCQPWSILLTGAALIGLLWVLTTNSWITVLLSMPIIIWMGYFLLIWPRLVRAAWVSGSPQQAPDSEQSQADKRL
jgi:hypothetical protein